MYPATVNENKKDPYPKRCALKTKVFRNDYSLPSLEIPSFRLKRFASSPIWQLP